MAQCVDQLKFIVPTKLLEGQTMEYKLEHLSSGEDEFHGGALLEKIEYDKWIKLVKKNMNKETVVSDWVVSSTFFVVRESD